MNIDQVKQGQDQSHPHQHHIRRGLLGAHGGAGKGEHHDIFLLYIPFVLIDMVVASTLMSMGMVMLPPSMISTPFKLLLFIMLDGWQLLFATLASGFTPDMLQYSARLWSSVEWAINRLKGPWAR